MEMASIIISILALIGTVYTYFVHDRKIKRQESIINEYQLAKFKEEEEESKKAQICGNIVKYDSGKHVLKFYNRGKAMATNINIQGLDIQAIDIYDNILPCELLNPQDYAEITFRIIMNAPSTIKLTYTWDDAYQTGNSSTQILPL